MTALLSVVTIVSSLAILLMDSYYRTLVGFQTLIDINWLSLGHKFYLGLQPHQGKQLYLPSYLFVIFIDAVNNLIAQYPTHFEFNTHLMVMLLDHVNSRLFGEFLFSTEIERTQQNVEQVSLSFW